MPSKKTLVLGASANPARYSYLAINKLRDHHHEVVAIGKKTAIVSDVTIATTQIAAKGIDTVTLYLNPGNQVPYYSYILSLHPRRIIFNPGTENPELQKLALQNNIIVQEACTLVLLSTNQY
ncbi:MAG: CoA-binding protein [Bacteroidetes bacterium]|nr:CoA-binding protein [Bacteroidota bacterium]MBS1755910.1 CoA-binding protein [Bacteroidota bacterium]